MLELTIEQVHDMDEKLADELAGLLVAVVEDGASIGFMLPFSLSQARDYWLALLNPNKVLWVAKMNGQLCGAVQLDFETKANGNHRCEVAKLMVSPQYRQLGIGRKLMQTLEQRAIEQGRELIVMDTREGDPSNQLYLSLGYQVAGKIPLFARSINGQLEGTVLYYKVI